MLTDGIDVSASPESGASREAVMARQCEFAAGDRVKLPVRKNPYFRNRQNGVVVNLTPTYVVVDWGNCGIPTIHVASRLLVEADYEHCFNSNGDIDMSGIAVVRGPEFAHVEPAASVEAGISGEAKL